MSIERARYVLTTASWATLIVSAWLSVAVYFSHMSTPWRWASYVLLIATSLVTALVSRRSAWPQVDLGRDAKVEILRELAKDARIRGDIGKDGGVEAWNYLNLYADKIEREGSGE